MSVDLEDSETGLAVVVDPRFYKENVIPDDYVKLCSKTYAYPLTGLVSFG
jgi:hypothetical protein